MLRNIMANGFAVLFSRDTAGRVRQSMIVEKYLYVEHECSMSSRREGG